MRWIAALVVGCGGGGDGTDGPGFPRACDESALDGDCILFSGDGWISADVTGDCEGSLLPSCPPGTDLGTCTVDAGEDFEVVTTFYTPFWSVADAAGACQGSGGTWVQAD